jgi:hypothetical protein
MHLPILAVETSEWVIATGCFSLIWGVLSTVLWLWIVLRVVAALERLSHAHMEMANAFYRIAERLPVRKDEAPPAPEPDWESVQPPVRTASNEERIQPPETQGESASGLNSGGEAPDIPPA